MFCPKCGKEVQEGSAFCGSCGAKVGTAARSVTLTPASAADGVAAAAVAPKKGKGKAIAVAVVAVIVVAIVAILCMNIFGENDSDGVIGGGGVKDSVNDYSWEELSKISNEIAETGDKDAAIEVAKKYNLCTSEGKLDGTQEKSMTLTDGTEIAVQICGFAHDDKTSGGKAGITFIFKDFISTTDMDSEKTNMGGWEAAPIRKWLNSTGLELLPDDLAKNIVVVDKLTNNVGETKDVSSVSTTSDSLWLFSDIELGGVSKDWIHEEGSPEHAVLNAEGSTYELFENTEAATSETLIKKDAEGGNGYWWGRSPNPYRGPNKYGFTPDSHSEHPLYSS